MNYKTLLFLLLLPAVTWITFKFISTLYHFEKKSFPISPINREFLANKKGKSHDLNILLTNMEENYFYGREVHVLNVYKSLLKSGYNIYILVPKNSKFEDELKKAELPYYAYNKFRLFKNVIQPAFYRAIYNICKEKNINIINSNIDREMIAIKKIAKKFPVKIIETIHTSGILKPKYAKNLDGLIGVSSKVKECIQKENKIKKLGIKNFVHIPPFFNNEKFINFKAPQISKKKFFKKNFNITLKDFPLICSIASVNERKNQKLIIKALAELIHQENHHAQVVFAGCAPNIEDFKNFAKNLKVDNYIHFLGYTNKIADILYHSDIKILASREEPLGIALMEAALMKKPIIAANNTGMVDVIKHEKTGLLFENDNLGSLVKQIEKLLNNPELQKKLGENAFNFVMQNFSPKTNIKKIIKFYEKVLTT